MRAQPVYAPRKGNDWLLLWLKGSLNEYELAIRTPKIGADVALRLPGSAAQGDPAYELLSILGRLQRSILLSDHVAIPDFRREIHMLRSRGDEPLQSLWRHCGR